MTRLKLKNRFFNFSYHLVENSPWPMTTAFSLFSLLQALVVNAQNPFFLTENANLTNHCRIFLILSFSSLVFSLFFWWSDIVTEGSKRGEHTLKVQKNLTLGFILFVLSEISMFSSFFFAYFYSSLIPDPKTFGGIWPPVGIEAMDYLSIPLLNTAILFFSGISITATHNFLINKNKISAIIYLFITISLGLLFVYFQYFEYFNALFTISDSVYGSNFFFITGFHGTHVIIGVIFLIVTLFRLIFNHFYFNHFLGFNFSSIYYHFVDVVWIFVFAILYCWGS
jgi:cytochrome c oxidase subunit 3